MHKVREVNTNNWEQDVIDTKEPTLVDFWAGWCPTCRSLSPVIDELAEEYCDRINIAKVNIDESPELLSKYNIESIPTVAMFLDGEMVDKQVGVASKDACISMIDKVLQKIPASQ